MNPHSTFTGALVHALSLDKTILQDFARDQQPLLRERVSITLWMGVVLVPFFGWVDYLLYPSLFARFMTYRLVASMACLVLNFANWRWDLEVRNIRLGIAGFYAVALAIISMIVATGGYSTPYYAGLNLVFLAFCAVLSPGTRVVVTHCTAVYLIYLGVVLYYNRAENIVLFLANNMFVITTILIGIIACFTEYNHRLKQYLLRQELEAVRAKLEHYSRSLESSVAESEAKYRLVVNHANESIFILQDDSITFPNPKAEELFGHPAAALAEMSLADAVVPEDRERVLTAYRQLEDGDGAAEPEPVRIVNRAGHQLWVDMSCVRIEWAGKSAILHLLRDITERKRMEVELIQAQKMEAIGTLAGGIAHEFNNLLQVMTGYLQLLFQRKSPRDPDFTYLKHIDKSAQRAAELTKKLLIYSRKVESKLQQLDLNQEITQVCDLLERIMPKMITIDKRLGLNLGKINADPAQLEQVLMNLAVNARDAMPRGGRFILNTRNFLMDEEFCQRHVGTEPGSYVLLTVSDTGIGMDQETLERIFDPFFTTKQPGKGTGLGLAIAYSIIKNHGGYILCNSERGRGTSFEIYFPVVPPGAQDEKVEEAGEELASGSGQMILLVDDEEDLLEIGREMLELNHFRTVTAEDGEGAVQLLAAHKEQITLVILDLNMPGMGGFSCLERLLEMKPSLKVIVVTGYLGAEQMQRVLKSGASGYIAKPYRFHEMLKKITEVLNAPAPGA